METQSDGMQPDIERAQLAEVQRRVAEVESGAVTLIPGEQVFAEVRRIVRMAAGFVDED
jgi:putative addiction module component (TIGR02574 family)